MYKNNIFLIYSLRIMKLINRKKNKIHLKFQKILMNYNQNEKLMMIVNNHQKNKKQIMKVKMFKMIIIKQYHQILVLNGMMK
jgi:hypothetical protein